jgi:hypothetical protein
VVWQGSAGDRRPYADQTAISETGTVEILGGTPMDDNPN